MISTGAIVSALALAGITAALPVQGGNSTLAKRDYTNARLTWFDVGLGSCGVTNSDSDYIVAMNIEQWDPSKSQCFGFVYITVGGKTVTAQITDLCPGCPINGLDLSPAVYDALSSPGAHGSDLAPGGPLIGSWSFADVISSSQVPPPPPSQAPPPPPSQAPPPPPPSNSGAGNRIHPNGDTSKCLDVQAGVVANGTPVQLYDCNGSGAQNWVVQSGQTAVQLAGTNFCLDAGSSPASGTQMKIWDCYSGVSQQTWYYTGDQRISLENQGFCLDVTSSSYSNGNVQQIWTCTTGNTNQVWTLS